MDVLSTEDLLFIVSTLYPSIEHSVLLKMITFNAKVCAYKCYRKLGNFSLYEIFVGKIFVGSTSYENILTRILQHSVCNSVARAGKKPYRESNCHGRVFRKEMLYSRLLVYKKYGR